MITAAVCKHGGDVFYYQGLHDITAVLLFTAGEKGAFRMLSWMAVCQLRDCTRSAVFQAFKPGTFCGSLHSEESPGSPRIMLVLPSSR